MFELRFGKHNLLEDMHENTKHTVKSSFLELFIFLASCTDILSLNLADLNRRSVFLVKARYQILYTEPDCAIP